MKYSRVILDLFNPANTTCKTFYAVFKCYNGRYPPYMKKEIMQVILIQQQLLMLVQFKSTSGNIDAGTITLYGIA